MRKTFGKLAVLAFCAASGTVFAADAVYAELVSVDSSGKLVTMKCTADGRYVSASTIDAAAGLCAKR